METDKGDKIKINKTAKVKIKDLDGNLEIKINDSTVCKTKKINLIATGLKAFFRITPIQPQLTERRYDDNLEISSKNKSLFIINVVKTENYLAGVVQSETWGATTNIDFFKIQAICCRNYMMNNLEKHSNEGYNLCDGVHCQAYKTRANKKEVTEGAYKSKGEIIVDSEGNIIETLFHSNSGGTTVNAKDVWGKEVPYLVSVEDSFSVGCKNYQWEKYIKLRDWLNYFKGKGLNIKNKENEIYTTLDELGPAIEFTWNKADIDDVAYNIRITKNNMYIQIYQIENRQTDKIHESFVTSLYLSIAP